MQQIVKTMRRLRVVALANLSAAAFLFLVPVAYIKGPRIEASLMPVWSSMLMEWHSVERDPWGLSASVTGHKARPECRPIEFIAMRWDGHIWHRTAFRVDGRVPGIITRPDGWQALGVWSFRDYGSRIRIAGSYRCHEWWDTPAILGEWSAPGPKT